MTSNKIKLRNTKLGLFVLSALAVFIFALYKLGDQQTLFGGSFHVYADFVEVKGLQSGNNVRYAGITIGAVRDISIINDTTIRVKMAVDEDAKTYLKTNAEAEITSNGLVGNMLVNIYPVAGNSSLVEDEGHIRIKKSYSTNDMISTLSETNDKMGMITDNLLEITNKLNTGEGTLSILLNDNSIANEITKTSTHLKQMSRTLENSSRSINTMLEDVKNGEGNLGYLIKDNSLKSEINTLSNDLDTLINVRTQPIFENLESTTEELEKASTEIATIIKEIKEGEGLAGAMVGDTSLVENLTSTMQNLENGTQKFDESMEALQSHWLLKGFFKKKKKKAAE